MHAKISYLHIVFLSRIWTVTLYRRKKEEHVSLLKTTRVATKRNTKWLVKLFQGKKPLLCFEINELNKQKLSEIDLFEKKLFSQCQTYCLNRVVLSCYCKHETFRFGVSNFKGP